MIILGETPSALQLLGVCAVAVAIPLGIVRAGKRRPAARESLV
jgi:threonine/homoserine efflux transporter RhtA